MPRADVTSLFNELFLRSPARSRVAGVQKLCNAARFPASALPVTRKTTGGCEDGRLRVWNDTLSASPKSVFFFFFPLLSKRQRGKCGNEVSRSFSAPGGPQPVLGDGETLPSGKRTSLPPTPAVSYPQITPDQFSPRWIINAAVLETQIKPFRPGLFQSFDLPKEPCPGLDVLFSSLPPASVRSAASSPAGEVWPLRLSDWMFGIILKCAMFAADIVVFFFSLILW